MSNESPELTHESSVHGGESRFGVLVFDPEPRSREAVVRLLDGPVFDVRGAASVVDCASRIRENGFGAVILDLDVPSGRWRDIVRAVDEARADEAPALIGVSARWESSRANGARAQLHACLRKPLSIARLRERLDRLRRKSAPAG